MIYGTAYFVDYTAALKYWKDYGDGPKQVQARLQAGTCHLGKPPMKATDRLILLDNNTRYGIDDGKP